MLLQFPQVLKGWVVEIKPAQPKIKLENNASDLKSETLFIEIHRRAIGFQEISFCLFAPEQSTSKAHIEVTAGFKKKKKKTRWPEATSWIFKSDLLVERIKGFILPSSSDLGVEPDYSAVGRRDRPGTLQIHTVIKDYEQNGKQ